jgi:hypothetical protein
MRMVVLVLGSILVGCGPASVSGEVAGTPIESSDAIFHEGTFLVDSVEIRIGGPTSDMCADIAAGRATKGGTALTLSITKDAVGVGTHTVGTSGGLTVASAEKLDTACSDVLKKFASSGTITITTKETTRIQGSFDLLFDSDHLTGSFDARACADTTVDVKTCN